ncbi:hypothetical protein EDB84DRAFT_1446398 [Lactarius hengduanensis]|nr:hypothetical protein EDB84DRAFT_1446398 [Lactarius hengduanensis]
MRAPERTLNLWRVNETVRVAQGLGGVKRCEVSRRPPRGASNHMWLCGGRARVGGEGLKAVRKCGDVRKGEWSWSVASGRKRSRTLRRGANLGMDGRSSRERVALELLRPHASAAR